MSQPMHVLEMFRLNGQTAMITGASGYLGTAMASALAEAGASVVISSRQLERAQQLAALLPSPGGAVHHAVELDQMNEESISAGFRMAETLTGGIDIFVNNGHEAIGADWKNITAEQFRRQLDNLTGYFLLSRQFRDQVVNRGSSGSLILVGSMYGVVGSYPQVYDGIGTISPAAYHALKGGIVQLNRHLAVCWAEDRVRVNCLSPGPFPSPAVPELLKERLIEKSPMKRLGTPEELKGALIFLASQAGSYMTGHNLIVDGGWTAW